MAKPQRKQLEGIMKKYCAELAEAKEEFEDVIYTKSPEAELRATLLHRKNMLMATKIDLLSSQLQSSQ